MAVKLIANYSKRLGLPGYSSHQFSVSVETELANTDNVTSEASSLDKTLQTAVDSEMESTGAPGGRLPSLKSVGGSRGYKSESVDCSTAFDSSLLLVGERFREARHDTPRKAMRSEWLLIWRSQ